MHAFLRTSRLVLSKPRTFSHSCAYCGFCACAACLRCSADNVSGYLQQALSDLIVKAMTALEAHRGTLKHPGLSLEDSAKAFVSLFLKAHNPASEDHIRQRQAQRLTDFLAECAVAQHIAAAPRGSAVHAARRSPRFSELKELGQRYDSLATEPREQLVERLFRPTPPTYK